MAQYTIYALNCVLVYLILKYIHSCIFNYMPVFCLVFFLIIPKLHFTFYISKELTNFGMIFFALIK